MNTIQDILVNEFDFGNLGISKKEESAFSKISEKIKNIAEKIAKNAQKLNKGNNMYKEQTDVERYGDKLYELSNESAFLESWYKEVKGKDEKIETKIIYICRFFEVIVLQLIINDIHFLLNHYFEIMGHCFCECKRLPKY